MSISANGPRPEINRRFGRRQSLAGLLLAACYLLGAKHSIPTAGGEDFLKISCFLTGRDHLEAADAQQFFAALAGQHADFAGNLAHLAASLAPQTPAGIDALDLGTLSAADRNCALAIISAWYTGIVGTGRNARVITFDTALLYDATRDAVPVPTYCSGPAQSWAGEPPPAPPTGFPNATFQRQWEFLEHALNGFV